MTVVIGTAGHIDHGKTSLLRALTGIDADRLPEERRRGLTIDIGYAHGSPDGGPEVDFVDVPGHDRLVGNMLAGVGEIDAALLVVAADDGPRAQTWEHLGLLDAMGVHRGLVAVTKIDLVDAARVRDVEAECADLTSRTRLADAPIVHVSATAGRGLAALRTELAALRERVTSGRVRRRGSAWLSIDRAFSVRGHGVVVTGSSRGTPLRAGDTLLVRPGSTATRVRAVHVHDALVDVAGQGRVALNLAGVELDRLRRGQLLTSRDVADDALDAFESDRLLVALHPPAALPDRPRDDPWPPRDGTRLRLHLGTDQVDVQLGRSGRLARTARDDRVYALLRLERTSATGIGERFVLRRPAPAGLLAGGVVLAADVPYGRARSRLERTRLDHLHAAVSGDDPNAIAVATIDLYGARGSELAPDVQGAARSALLRTVAVRHHEQPGEPGLALGAARAAVAAAIRSRLSVREEWLVEAVETTITAMIAEHQLVQEGDTVRSPEHRPAEADPAIAKAADSLVELLDQDAPPALSAAAAQVGYPEAAIRELVRSGRIELVSDDLAWSAEAFLRLQDRALALADEAPLTPAAMRDATGTSRKYVMALLEEFDRRGILMRTPAGHVRGPRA